MMSLVQLTVPPLSTCKVLASRYFVVVPAIVSVAPDGTIVVPLPDCRPPVQLILDDNVRLLPPLSVPAVICRFWIVTAPPIVKVPALNRAVPAPVILPPAFSVCVPPSKPSTVPLATVKPLVLGPPPRVRLNVPVCTSTVPVLVKVISIVLVPLPTLLRNVPALLNVDTVPAL